MCIAKNTFQFSAAWRKINMDHGNVDHQSLPALTGALLFCAHAICYNNPQTLSALHQEDLDKREEDIFVMVGDIMQGFQGDVMVDLPAMEIMAAGCRVADSSQNAYVGIALQQWMDMVVYAHTYFSKDPHSVRILDLCRKVHRLCDMTCLYLRPFPRFTPPHHPFVSTKWGKPIVLVPDRNYYTWCKELLTIIRDEGTKLQKQRNLAEFIKRYRKENNINLKDTEAPFNEWCKQAYLSFDEDANGSTSIFDEIFITESLFGPNYTDYIVIDDQTIVLGDEKSREYPEISLDLSGYRASGDHIGRGHCLGLDQDNFIKIAVSSRQLRLRRI